MKSKFTFLLILLSFVLNARLPDLIPYRKGNLWGFCDSTKKIILEPQWESVSFFRFGRAEVHKDGKAGLIDSLGNYVIAPRYYYLYPVGRTRFVAATEKDHAGLIDDSGNVILPFTARWIEQASDSVLCFPQKGNKAMVCDLNGKPILHGDYLGWDFGVGNASHLGLFVVIRRSDLNWFWGNNDPKMIVIDTAERQLFPGKYYCIELINDTVFKCTMKDSICYYDIHGKPIVEEEWPSVDERIAGRERPHPKPELYREYAYFRNEKGEQEERCIGFKSQHGTEYWED